jgi:fructose-1,6-bisphosphatase/sedoheptulose 1,7-bisphosphatase-like protein
MKNLKAERELSLDFLRVTEAAAIESAKTMGQGDRKYSDHVAVEAMREVMDTVPMRGRIVIGEGERDEARCCTSARNWAAASIPKKRGPIFLRLILPLTRSRGPTCVLSGPTTRSRCWQPPNAADCCTPRIFIWTRSSSGHLAAGAVDIDAPVEENLKNIARRLGRDIEDLTVICLERGRHKKLIDDVRAAGARIRLISDGDLSAGISAAVAGTNIHALMGIGGAPEGVITAAAMKCLNGEILAKLVFDPDRLGVDRSKVPPVAEVMARLSEMGISDPNKIYDTNDLAPGKKIIFAATGVTDGALLRGVRFFGAGKRTHSVVMTTDSKSIRFVDTVHVEGGPDAVIRF